MTNGGEPDSPGENPVGADSANDGLVEELTAHTWVWDPDNFGVSGGGPGGRGVPGTFDALRPTMDFGDDGSIAGRAGCNTYRTSFELDDDGALGIGPIATTRMMCEPAVMDIERRFLEALAQVSTIEVRDRSLMLHGDGVELLLTVLDVDSPPGRDTVDLNGDEQVGNWEIIDYRTPESLRTPVPGTSPTVQFGDDDSVSLDTGCNRIVSSIVRHPGTDGDVAVEFRAPIQTLKACPEPEGVMDQEVHLARALMATTRLHVESQALRMVDDDGRLQIRASRIIE